MLTPAYLAGVASEVVDVYAQVEQEILDDIVRRTMKLGYVSDYTAWQVQKARQFGMFQSDVNDLLRRSTVTASKDVKLIMAQAAKDALAFDDEIYRKAGLTPLAISKSPALQALVLQGTSNTLQLLSNFTKTTSIESTAVFQSVLDRTYIKILSGTYSPQTAIHAAIKELANNGLDRVAYGSSGGGVHYQSLEASVRRAVTTGVNQSIAKLQLARADEMGCELVEVSAHAGARPSHAEWQGEVYALGSSGRRDYPHFEDTTGYGTGEGLCGWNCYHSFAPFFDGLSTRAFSNDPAADVGRDNDVEYEQQQKQRYYERQIRDAKREVATLSAAMTEAKSDGEKAMYYQDFQRASVKLKRREAAMRDFLESTGRSREWYREQTGGWNRSVSAKASWAYRRSK